MGNKPIGRQKADELNDKLRSRFWASNASIKEADNERAKLTHDEEIENAISEGWDSLGWDEYE